MSQENGIVHLWELPKNKVYIRFKQTFRNHFYQCLLKEFGQWKIISEKFNISYNNFNGNALRNYPKPLSFIFKLCEELEKRGYKEFNKQNLEKQIERIQWLRSKPILNPKLPFNFNSPDGGRIVSGFLHDGSIKKNLYAKYSNKEQALLKKFLRSISKVFGEVPSKEWKFDIDFPKIVGAIVVFGLEMKKGKKTITNPEIPKFIMKAEIPVISIFIDQAISDEGTVSFRPKYNVRSIKYHLSVDVTNLDFNLREKIKESPKLFQEYAPNTMKDLKFLFEKRLQIKTNNLSFERENEYLKKDKRISFQWSLQITGYENLRRFQELITLTHLKKRKLLLQAIDSYERIQVQKGTALLKTLETAIEAQVEYGLVTSKNLSETMNISLEAIQERLKRLRAQNLLKVVDGGYKKGVVGQESFKYIITQDGLNYLER